MTIQPGLFLGIDTGGTFTDGVLLNPETHAVIKTEKVLTTHSDLSICIGEIIAKLAPDDASSIALVCLSTTLATNVIAEGKRKPVALLLLGYDADLVHKFNFQHQFGTPYYYFIRGKHGLDGVEQEPLDEMGIIQAVNEVNGKVEAFAISSYAGSRNSEHEERAGKIVASITDKAIVQAHHLSRELDSIRRATTASLNASLLSNTREFLITVQEMLNKRHMGCPVMIVRGDGSIVRAEYALKRPVEIIHSGPATSAIGGQFLSGEATALVIDIGGTTTDIALVEKGSVQIEAAAATVGPYRTCVKTIKVRSFGLGGDSQIRFDSSLDLTVGPERVLPISHLCAQYPQVRQELAEWVNKKDLIHYYDRLEYWTLCREPSQPLTNPRAQKAIQLLKGGPWFLPKLLKAVGAVSPLQLSLDNLVNQEIIERSGLTPTDLLHVTGEFSPWDGEIAGLIVDKIAGNWEIEGGHFIQKVKDIITRRIVSEIIQFLTGKTLSDPVVYGIRINDLDRWLFDESLAPENSHLGSHIVLKDPLVGIGAPARAFLPAVAQALGTQILLPDHYEVANAVGTVVGNVMIHQAGEVAPWVVGTVVKGYFARVGNLQHKFEKFDEALAFVRTQLVDLATTEAINAGAVDPQIECAEEVIYTGMMARLSAWAIAKPCRNGHL